MLTYNLGENNMPLYEQLYNQIKKDISDGVLKADEHLPSKRNFARHLGVSTITVENAYDQLISEGYMYAIEKKGYYVSDISDIHKVKKSELKKEDIMNTTINPVKFKTDEKLEKYINDKVAKLDRT